MSTDFLSMPDDELPEFAAVESQLEAEREAAISNPEPEEPSHEPTAEVDEDDVPADETTDAEDQDSPDEPEASETPEAQEPASESEEPEVNPLAEPDDAPAPAVKEKAKDPVAEAKQEKEPATGEPAKEPEATTAPAAPVDPLAFQSKILAPFKANGRDIQVKDADEAIRLMQMGANYNLKMATLKPTLGMMRQLEDAGLLNPEQIAHVIDLVKNKNPAAIAKLAKDANVDPLDVKEEDVNNYAPKAVPVDDRRQALEDTLDHIQHLPSYQRVLKTTRSFDAKTKEIITDEPHVLAALEAHMTMGVYDRIETEINRRRALGSIPSEMPFLHAYKQVGDELQEQGAFNDLAQAAATTPAVETPAAPVKKAVTAAPVKKDPAVEEKRRAAAPTKTSPATTRTNEFNPLALSDEEFEKHFQQHMQYSQ